ncbi:MAG TPA: DUF72 domain-containing protein, partial [Candidatus Nitrosocosmicus sp.]
FAIKFPKIITHEKKMRDIAKELYIFFNVLEPLLNKTLVLIIQLPPYLTENKCFESLQNMVNRFDNRFRYALEVRDSSWFNDKIYDFLKDNKITLVWSVRDELKTPYIVTSDQIYIRFIGDRSIDEIDFGKIVKNRDTEMVDCINRINKLQYEMNDHKVIAVAFNNHFAGFGPQSANTFLKLMDEPEIKDWSKEIKQNNSITKDFQKSISDFTF